MPKETVLFALIPEYADWEPALLAAALRRGFGMWEKAYEVKVAAPDREPASSIGGFRVVPDCDFESAPDDFAARLEVTRDEQNPNRLNWMMQPDLVNQFRVAATAIRFLL